VLILVSPPSDDEEGLRGSAGAGLPTTASRGGGARKP
jgi:hypothetical protein